MEKYNIVNGTCYNEKTPQAVINVLEAARVTKTRIKVYFGDIKTGKDWCEVNDTAGYVGRSTGNHKIPILVSKINSYGGGALLDGCIVKIRESKGSKVLYTAYNYQAPKLELKQVGSLTELYVNDTHYSTHDTPEVANRLMKRLS